jgi:putative oxidoreductase
VIIFTHGTQKVLGCFGGYGWRGTTELYTQTLHVLASLAAIAFFAEFLGESPEIKRNRTDKKGP